MKSTRLRDFPTQTLKQIFVCSYGLVDMFTCLSAAVPVIVPMLLQAALQNCRKSIGKVKIFFGGDHEIRIR